MNRAVYTLASVLVALLLCAIMVSCGKGYDVVTSVSSDTTIPVEKALQTLSSFNQQTGAETRTQSRQISSVDVTYTEDHTPLAYLVNYSDGKGFAVLAADTGMDPIIAVTDSGSADWSSIMSSADKQLNNASPDYPEVLIAKLIKNGITNPRGGGDDDDDEEEEGGENGPGGGGGGGNGGGSSYLHVDPMTSNLPFGQIRSYCHKSNGGYVICGCATTAMAIVSSYNQYPVFEVDSELINFSNCNSYDGSGIEYNFSTDDHPELVYFPAQDYFYDYSLIPVSMLSDTALVSLIKKIDNNICNVHGFPTSVNKNVWFKRTQHKLCAAIYSMLDCTIRSWAATAVMPGDLEDGLTDLGYLNVDYHTHGNMNDHLDSLSLMLTNGKPAIMCGWSLWELSDSHFWVVDGIHKTAITALIHCNWGWSGWKNGWFSKNCINPNVGSPNPDTNMNVTDSTSTWNHLILYQYDVPTTTDTVRLNPTLAFKRNYYE